MKNKIICGDCEKVLSGIPSESIDLIYLDPPFSSNRNYVGFWQKTGEKLVFDDHWEAGVKGYIDWITPKIEECYRVLKPTGSLYFHCDWHANAHIRLMLDKIFGVKNFRNEIVWKRTTHIKGTSGTYGNIIDFIYFYSKSSGFIFNKIKNTLSNGNIDRDYNNVELETGRKYNHGGMFLPGNSPKILFFRDKQLEIIAPIGKRFRWSQKTYDERYNKNKHCIHWNKNGTPRYKIYLDEHCGIPVTNIWDDILAIVPSATENLGYPTQKPEALLERIIKASSNNGDLVLDPFCGCGTTLAVAAKLNRDFIGIDESRLACKVMNNRLKVIGNLDEVIAIKELNWTLEIPNTIDTIRGYDWFNFQTWVNEKLGAIQGKRGADKGIDGTTFQGNTVLFDSVRKKDVILKKGSIIQSKHFKHATIGEPHMKKFESTIRRSGTDKGVMVGWKFSKGAKEYSFDAEENHNITIYLLKAEDLYNAESYPDPYQADYKFARQSRLKNNYKNI